MNRTFTGRWVLVQIVTVLLCACGLRGGDFEFNEEVQLADGQILTVVRKVSAEPLGEIGGPGGWEPKYMSMEVVAPKRSDVPPKWESREGLIPILFDKDPGSGEWVVLATFYTCEPWYRLGRPKRPYAEFRVREGRWQRVDMKDQWVGRAANVLTDISSRGEPDFVSLGAKKDRMSNMRIVPKYRMIVEQWTHGC